MFKTFASLMKRIGALALPAIGLCLFLGVWEIGVRLLMLPSSVLPSPWDIVRTLSVNLGRGIFYSHIAATAGASLAGLAIAVIVGLLSAIVVSESAAAHRFVYPVLSAMQAMPIVAIAPLMIVWLGIGINSKIWLVAISCFFPIFINSVAGLRSADRNLSELYRVYGASKWRTLVELKLPSSVDYVMSAIQVGVALSLISCVVGEFLAARAGLGYLIKAASGQLNLTLMFSSVLILAVMGIIGATTVRTLHVKLTFWDR